MDHKYIEEAEKIMRDAYNLKAAASLQERACLVIASALEARDLKHQREVEELREAIMEANKPIKHNDIACLQHDCSTVDKANLTLEIFSERNIAAFDACRSAQLEKNKNEGI